MYDWYQGITYAQFLAYWALILFCLRWIKIFNWSRDLLYILKKVFIEFLCHSCQSTYPFIAMLLVCWSLCYTFVLFMHAIYGGYRVVYRNIYSTIMTAMQIFHIGDTITLFDVLSTSQSSTFLSLYAFIFIFCISLGIPSFAAAILFDSVRKLRLLIRGFKPKQEHDSWGRLWESK